MDELIDVIGYPAASLLCAAYSGCTLYIPTQKSLKLAARNRLIKADRLAGMLLNDLALKYQLTTRRIISICKN